MIPVDGALHKFLQLFAMLALTSTCTRCVVELNSVFVGKFFDGADEVEMLNLLHEREDIALSSATEAHVTTSFIVNTE